MTITPEAVEALAREMCVALGEDPDGPSEYRKYLKRWNDHEPFARNLLAAQAALRARDAGQGERTAQLNEPVGLGSLKWSGSEAMTDAQIIAEAIRLSYNGVAEAETVIRLTRANPPKLSEAQVEDVIDQIMVDWGSPIDGAREKIREALRLAKVAE